MEPGDIMMVPSNVIHQVEALEDSVFCEAFGPGPNLEKEFKRFTCASKREQRLKQQQKKKLNNLLTIICMCSRRVHFHTDNLEDLKYAMATITYIEHSGTKHEIDVENGSTIMEGATDNLLDGIIGECGGCCSCATCHVIVDNAWLRNWTSLMKLK